MIPNFPFLPLEEIRYIGLIGCKLGSGKAKYVGTDVLHLKEEVEHFGSIIVKAYTIDILEVYSKYLFFPVLGVWPWPGSTA
jgi:hypothetical protein